MQLKQRLFMVNVDRRVESNIVLCRRSHDTVNKADHENIRCMNLSVSVYVWLKCLQYDT